MEENETKPESKGKKQPQPAALPPTNDWQAAASLHSDLSRWLLVGCPHHQDHALSICSKFDETLVSFRDIKWLSLISTLNSPGYEDLQREIAGLRASVESKACELRNAETVSGKKEEVIRELQEAYKALQAKQALNHLLTRVGRPAQDKVLADQGFQSLFSNGKPCQAFVLSIDIRRSTELMLKARQPRLFAEFIMSLAVQLREIVLDHYGIFDKFTGDGILAFFPDFYSDLDAGYYAVTAANECHRLFTQHYATHRNCFISILKDTGLGIGLDYGSVEMLQIGGDFTVVGTPVVYACRMAGADAGTTLVNQPAYEELFQRYQEFDFEQTEIDIKNEGATLAYRVKLNDKTREPLRPKWLDEPVPDKALASKTTKDGPATKS